MSFKKKTENIDFDGVAPEIRSYLESLPEEIQKEIVVTAGKEKRKGNSRHNHGRAVDLRFNDKVWNYISTDPNRHKSGLTLINPDHGTAKHIHLSSGEGSENDLDVDKVGKSTIAKQPVPQVLKEYQTLPAQEQTSWLQTFSPTTQPSPVTAASAPVDMTGWNYLGWKGEGQKVAKVAPEEQAAVNTLLDTLQPPLRQAMSTILEAESSRVQKPNWLDEGSQTQGWLAQVPASQSQNATPQKNSKQGQYNAGNIRNADGSFKSYNTPQEGFQGLVRQLNLYQTGKTKNPVKGTSTLLEAMSVYAPKSDNNNPEQYAQFIADKIGVNTNTPIQDINTESWAQAISQMEGNTSYLNNMENGGWLNNTGYTKGSKTVNNSINVIPTNNITMKNVEFPVLGTDNTGTSKVMLPEQNYQFPGDYVVETPMLQNGGVVYNPNLAKQDKDFTTWYKKNTLEGQNKIPYSDSLDYDYYSFFKNQEHLNPNYSVDNHFPDTYKRPSHETFSSESIYSTPENPGGSWQGEQFIPWLQTLTPTSKKS